MDRFEDLRAFVQVVESGSLTRAATSLNVATSAVSRRIRDLEARLGSQLLQRTTRQMRLTGAGEQFHARAIDILQALEEAEAEAGDQSRALTGPLRIAAPLSFGRTHLTPLLLDFMREHPEIEMDVDLSDRFVDLVAEGHDLALRIGNLADSSLIAARVAEVRTVVAAAPDFWARHGRPAVPEDLAAMPSLRYNGSQRSDIWKWRDGNGAVHSVAPAIVMSASNGELLRDAAIAGFGMVLQPSFILRDAVVDGTLETVLTDVAWPTVTIHVVYPQTRHLSARARAFIDFIRDRIGQRPAWEDFLDTPA